LVGVCYQHLFDLVLKEVNEREGVVGLKVRGRLQQDGGLIVQGLGELDKSRVVQFVGCRTLLRNVILLLRILEQITTGEAVRLNVDSDTLHTYFLEILVVQKENRYGQQTEGLTSMRGSYSSNGSP
jgi:hypothetical protein